MAGESRVNRYLSRLRDYEREKQPWLIHYQALAEIYLTRKADFTHAASPGDFLQDNVFDNTAQFAAYVMASTFLSMLWPDSSRTFNIKPVRRLKDQPGVEAYFRYVTEEMHTAMDRAEAGLQLAFMEHFLDQGIFGTSGVAVFEGPEDDVALPVVYEAWDVKSMCISQNAQGFVDTIYFKINRTVRQVYEEYGAGKPGDHVSAHVVEKYKAGKYEDKIGILKVIEPKKAETGKKGWAAMPVRTVHIDITNKLIMREGGFEEMPVYVARMFKRIDEIYGRSPGMIALPAAISLNGLSEAVLVATEKQLDPPLAILDDGRLGGAVVDTSAGALTVLNASGRLGGEKPIFPLFTVGEMQSAEKLKEQLIQEIMQAFFLDRLLDLNNKTMMTAFETSIRNRLRGESLGSIFSRQEKEVLTPVITRTFNIMWRRGHFGVVQKGGGAEQRQLWKSLTGKDDVIVPDIIVKAVEAGLDIYEVEYISPAKRFMQAEKLQGLFTALDSIAALVPIFPNIVHRVDADILAHDIYPLAGAPKRSLRTMDDTRRGRAAEAERQNAAVALSAGKDLAQIQRDSAQARASMGTMGGGMGGGR